ncbi:hypothetical protein [Nitratireductor alexandrii]|uniref:hypothetical protein n=1 Tax=Nitratireductor alexandrii TaxID=2448161 RepID=UPI000FD85A44|nr:hypothetical protein [Nitratireductor alexandrii]
MDEYNSLAAKICAEKIRAAYSRGRPAHFLIGAGCSISCGIPTAQGILSLIEKKFPNSFNNLPEEDRKNYRKAIDLLPRNERRDLIISITEEAKISWGYLALARLLEKGYVDAVLSLNFDQQLQIACSLVGFSPAIYDIAATKTVNTNYLVFPSIIHLHGQSYGFIQLNTEKENRDHSKNIKPMLDFSLSNSPLFAIGYSGESDNVFQTIQKQYDGAEYLTWLGHESSPRPHLNKILTHPAADYLGNIEFDAFMVSLAIELNEWPPMIVTRPLERLKTFIDNISTFRPGADQQSIDLKYFSKTKIEQMDHDWNKDYGRLPKFEQSILSMNFDDIVKRFERSRNKHGVLSSPFHRNIVSWSYSEVSYKLWVAVANGKIEEKGEKAATLKKSLRNINKAISIEEKNDYLNNKINIFILLYHITKKEKHLKSALELYWGTPHRKRSDKMGYNIISAYSEMYKIRKDGRYRKKVDEIWNGFGEFGKSKPYNYICFLSVVNDIEGCKNMFLHAAENGKLPDKDYIGNDKDLENIRKERWFQSALKAMP